jgi:hypothetical protein
MLASVVHRIHARGAVAMRTLYVRPDAIVGLPDDVCVLEVSRLLRELVLAAVSYAESLCPGRPRGPLNAGRAGSTSPTKNSPFGVGDAAGQTN